MIQAGDDCAKYGSLVDAGKVLLLLIKTLISYFPKAASVRSSLFIYNIG